MLFSGEVPIQISLSTQFNSRLLFQSRERFYTSLLWLASQHLEFSFSLHSISHKEICFHNCVHYIVLLIVWFSGDSVAIICLYIKEQLQILYWRNEDWFFSQVHCQASMTVGKKHVLVIGGVVLVLFTPFQEHKHSVLFRVKPQSGGSAVQLQHRHGWFTSSSVFFLISRTVVRPLLMISNSVESFCSKFQFHRSSMTVTMQG